jgi:hypothetical protein
MTITPTSEQNVSVALPGIEGIRSWRGYATTNPRGCNCGPGFEADHPTLTSLRIALENVIDLERIPG